jgi:glycerol-3-phosphate dehydrogenase (NAD(P)+)
MQIAVLGAGAWGTALAVALAPSHQVTLWARDPQQRAAMQAACSNERYLPGISFPASLQLGAATASASQSLAQALDGAQLALLAMPTAGLRSLLALVWQQSPAIDVLWVCKGFERDSGQLPHEVVQQVRAGLGDTAGSRADQGSPRYGALSGPSFAKEVACGQPTALTVSSLDHAFASEMSRELHQPALRLYHSSDLVGVEVGGAVKNVLAIATGICDGLGLGMNARAALMTRGLAEMRRLGEALGGRSETFMGLTGMGDLILTCTGDLSRNRRVGLELAAGLSLQQVLQSLGHVAEGVLTAAAVQRRARELKIEMPITDAVCAVLFEGLAPVRAVQLLLARDPRAEG